LTKQLIWNKLSPSQHNVDKAHNQLSDIGRNETQVKNRVTTEAILAVTLVALSAVAALYALTKRIGVVSKHNTATMMARIVCPPVVDGSNRARATAGSLSWFLVDVRAGETQYAPKDARCVWDFGDGQTSEGMNVFHVFTTEGNGSPQHTVMVTVTTKGRSTTKAALVVDVVSREMLLRSSGPIHSWGSASPAKWAESKEAANGKPPPMCISVEQR
jgi:hypothetical protein